MSRTPSDTVALSELGLGESGVIESFDLPQADADRLMQLGFLPGAEVRYQQRSPMGDPAIYHVEGADVALRRETSARILVRAEAT